MEWFFSAWNNLYDILSNVVSWLLPISVVAVAIRLVWRARDNGF